MTRERPVRICEGGEVRLLSATRLTILCRGSADAAMTALREMMGRLKLTVNEEKTQASGANDAQPSVGASVTPCPSAV
jgi:hypothetical protein